MSVDPDPQSVRAFEQTDQLSLAEQASYRYYQEKSCLQFKIMNMANPPSPQSIIAGPM